MYVNDEKNRKERAQAKRELYSFERIFAAKREKQLKEEKGEQEVKQESALDKREPKALDKREPKALDKREPKALDKHEPEAGLYKREGAERSPSPLQRPGKMGRRSPSPLPRPRETSSKRRSPPPLERPKLKRRADSEPSTPTRRYAEDSLCTECITLCMGEGTLGPAEVPKMGTVPIAECPTIPECATEEELRALNQASHEKDLCTRCNVNLIGGPARTDSRSVRTKYNQRIASSMLDDALVTNCTAVLNRCSTALRGAEEPCLSDTRKRMLNDLATELHGANAQIQERLAGMHTRGRDEAGSVVNFLHESVAVSSWRGNSEREMNRWHAVWTPTDDPVPNVTSDDQVPDVVWIFTISGPVTYESPDPPEPWLEEAIVETRRSGQRAARKVHFNERATISLYDYEIRRDGVYLLPLDMCSTSSSFSVRAKVCDGPSENQVKRIMNRGTQVLARSIMARRFSLARGTLNLPNNSADARKFREGTRTTTTRCIESFPAQRHDAKKIIGMFGYTGDDEDD